MTRLALRRPAAAAVLVFFLGGSGAGPGDLRVDPADPRIAQRPDLKGRLLGSAHSYFRFINNLFNQETCALFADVAASLPEVNLHGDAHVEQYAVTSLGRGLTDLDDTTKGKPVIDLVRFGTSLVLAAREQGWRDADRTSLAAFLRGYRDALRKPQRTTPTPDLVVRTRRGFARAHGAALRQAHEIIDADPLRPEDFAQAAARFAELILAERRDLTPAFFALKRVGALRLGVGSALDEKYLAIFEGRTASPDDDLVVEAKQIRDLTPNPCLRTDVGASRILDGEMLISYEPFPFGAVVPLGGRYFWVHDWTDDYQEATIGEIIRTPKDLRELAYDAGIQLGRAHPKRLDGLPDRQRQRAATDALRRLERRIRDACFTLAQRTEAAWREYRAAASSGRPSAE